MIMSTQVQKYENGVLTSSACSINIEWNECLVRPQLFC